MNAREYLEQVRKLDRLIKNKRLELEQCEAYAEGMSSGGKSVLVEIKQGKYELQNMEKVMSSGNNQKMADAVLEVIDVKKEIEEFLKKLNTKRKEIISVIEQVEKPLEYTVLYEHYINLKKFTDIASEEDYSYQYIIEVHGKALESVQNILNYL